MTAAASFRVVYLTCRAFGIFPYKPVDRNKFRLEKSAVRQGRIILWVTIIFRLIIGILDVKYNLYSISRTIMTIIRVGNTSFLHILTMILYRTLFRYCRSMCSWLNQMAGVYSSIQKNAQPLLKAHCCLTWYSITFYFVTNSITLIQLIRNGKFIKGWIALFDSGCFMSLLFIQHLYLYGFLTMINFVKTIFTEINAILGEKKLQHERGSVLLKKLRKLRVQHLTVTDYLDFLKSVFGVYLLFYILWSSISTLFIAISVVIFDWRDAITLGLWIFYHPCQNMPILYVCTAIVGEAKKSANLIHELLIDNEDPEIKEETEIFSLQLQHRSTEFSVCGFFNLNLKFYVSITGVIATYIFALIQIHPNHVLDEETSSPDHFTRNPQFNKNLDF